jgi:hypothetical protein
MRSWCRYWAWRMAEEAVVRYKYDVSAWKIRTTKERIEPMGKFKGAIMFMPNSRRQIEPRAERIACDWS